MTERLAGARRPGRRGRLRDDGRRRGRPRRGPLPHRRARPVPGEPRRGPVRRLSGPDRRPSARRSSRAGRVPDHGRIVVTHLGVGLADVIFANAILRARGDARHRRWSCRGDDRPRRGRRRDDGRLDRAARAAGRPRRRPSSTRTGPATRGRRPATRPGSSARPTAPDELYATWARGGARRLDRARRARPARPSTSRAGRSGSPTTRTASRRRPAATLDGLGIRVERLDAGRGRRAVAADHVVGPAVRRLRARWRAPDGASRASRPSPAGSSRRAAGSSSAGRSRDGRTAAACSMSRPATARGTRPATFVFAGGPWLPRLFPALLGDLIKVTKQDVVYVGPSAGDGRFDAPRMPCLIDYDAAFYGIPSVEGRGFKLAPDRYGPVFDPSTGERLVDPESVRLARRYLARAAPRAGRRARRRDPRLPVRDDARHAFHHRPPPRLRQRLDRRRRLGPRVQARPGDRPLRHRADRRRTRPAPKATGSAWTTSASRSRTCAPARTAWSRAGRAGDEPSASPRARSRRGPSSPGRPRPRRPTARSSPRACG